MADETKLDVMLDMDAPDFADRLIEAIGAKPGDTISISTPQFTRTDGLEVPKPICDFTRLHELSDDTLKAIGCQKWDKDENGTHWLYPGEWYDHIPEGTPIIDISGNRERFERGVTDDDIRFGALAYGFIKADPITRS